MGLALRSELSYRLAEDSVSMLNRSELLDHLDLTTRDLTREFLGRLETDLLTDSGEWVKRGGGLCTIDLITQACTHDDRPIERLGVAGWLNGWLRESLLKAGLTKSAARVATLDAELCFERYQEQRDAKTTWNKVPAGFWGCSVTVCCHVHVDQLAASATDRATFEWPAESSP